MGESEIDIKRVAAFLSARVEGRVPDVAVVCGSGLASLAEGVQNKTTISFEDVPTYPSMTVPGHVGEFVFGEIGDKFVVCIAGVSRETTRAIILQRKPSADPAAWTTALL